MRSIRAPLAFLALAIFALSLSAVSAQDTAEPVTAKLKYKAVKKWVLILPKEAWSSASGAIGIAHQGGDGFATSPDGMKLMVDTTGDGRTNDVVKGVKGFLQLKGKRRDGKKFQYALRFQKQGAGWQYASSGYWQGRIGGESITVIDQNNNGLFNEYGVDAMVVGKSKAAGFLSKVVSLKGDIYNFEVSADGSSMNITPYAGETGTMDLRRNFKTYGQLISAIVSNETGDVSFDVASAKKGLTVPVGSYVLSGGYAAKGSETCRIRTGNMTPFEVKAGDTSTPQWGAPLTVDFAYTIQDGVLKVPPPPTNVKYYGAAGEEYYDWKPDATSPEIIVTDKATGREVAKGRFGGC